jgi:hypothetical protein
LVIDALVWALTELMTQPMSSYGIYELYRQAAAGLPPSPVDVRLEWRRRYDQMTEQDTPRHPDCTGGDIEYVNGPRALLPRAADRLLERCAEENQRFAALGAPTAEQINEHIATMDNIRTGRA